MASYREVRKFLNSYRQLKKSVKVKEKHLSDFINEMYVPVKTSIAKLARHSTADSPALSLMFKINNMYLEIIEDLARDVEATKDSLEEIFNLISKLDNCERSICFYRYIMGCSWSETAMQLGYEERQCQRREEAALRKIAARWVPGEKYQRGAV